LGGGISVSLHHQGKMIDISSDDEGPFSPERAGRVPCRKLIDLCYSGKYDHQTMRRMLRGKGGLLAYLDTNSALEVEQRINNGDQKAVLVYQAMAYQIAKAIGELATVVKGKVDRIALTGGLAHSKMLTGWITERVEFIAPVAIFPGENELESLALGALRVLRGQEVAHEFVSRN
jgi:butyrate kinase